MYANRKEVKRVEITEMNCRVVNKIMEILADEKCTVENAQEILREVGREITRNATVHLTRKLSDTYHE